MASETPFTIVRGPAGKAAREIPSELGDAAEYKTGTIVEFEGKRYRADVTIPVFATHWTPIKKVDRKSKATAAAVETPDVRDEIPAPAPEPDGRPQPVASGKGRR